MKQALDFISFVPWQFVVSMANVYILYRIVKHFLFKPVEALFTKRELEVETLYKTAEDRENEALSEKEIYEEKLQNLMDTEAEVLFSANEKAKKESQALLHHTQEKSEALLKKSEKEAEKLKEQALLEAQSEISDMAVLISEKITQQELSEEEYSRLMKKAFQELEELSV